ncbi:head GIN domain-containing protein [Sediminibacterium ginsengisoli]|uniref:Putative auto-transporter adhesin, head GIN domain n=1 Tax=Sediminibacterium ginsengisoli TaxID=413434 RepID=A0A1T4PXY8_9BACT|nr:head GIN domain-containing protein [Sediminibacterium ginsengisoli]SJZ96353.1 Putative auto-transporter adhesin, head GIN domain [Sediminibacterium ginsengisoli]
MKQKLLLVTLVLISFAAVAQWPFNKVEGNGVIKKEKREVGSFSAISSSGAWDVMLAYGNSGSIEIEGDENLLEHIETKVEDGKLIIRTKNRENIQSRRKIVIYASATTLKSVSQSGSGDIIGEGKFENSGSTKISVSGSGSIRLNFKQFAQTDVSVSGSGNIKLEGTTQKLSGRVSGSGNIDCDNLIADDVEAGISGSGNMKAYAAVSISASISGSGNVYYRGNAKQVSTRTSGSGRVKKRD